VAKHYHFRNFEFWAERGMISLIDKDVAADSHTDKQSHFRIGASQFMKRAVAILASDTDKYPSERREKLKLIDEAKEACLLAKKQGDPMDPSVIEDVVRHQRKRQIVMPGEVPDMKMPPGIQAPAPHNIRQKPESNNAGDMLRDGFDVTPDLGI